MRLNFLRRHFVIPRGQEAGHSEQIRTDAELYFGPPPDKVDRPGDMRLGIIGRGVNAFPPTWGMEYVGHVPQVHLMKSPTLQPGNTFDDKSTVPAIFAGNPQ